MKINWSLFSSLRPPNSLCVGEEKSLTDSEVSEINQLMTEIGQHNLRLNDLFEQASIRFRAKMQVTGKGK